MLIYVNKLIFNIYNFEFKIVLVFKVILDRWVSILVLEIIYGVYVLKLGVYFGILKNNIGRYFCYGE